MAHFAELTPNDVVLRVVVVDNRDTMTAQGVETDEVGLAFLARLFGGGIWVQCSYSCSARKNFPAPGFTYDRARDAFIAPKPFPSWRLDETTCRWESPVPMPTDGGNYAWDEATLSWIASHG